MGAAMTYALALGILLCLAAWLAEHTARALGRPQRWIWVAVLVVTASAVGWGPAPEQRAAGLAPVTVPAAPGPSIPWVPRPPVPPLSLDPILGGAWLALSALVLLGLARSHWRLSAERRTWDTQDVDGLSVRVSPDTGPAALGLLRPVIVVPRWALELPPDERAVLLRHEVEHLRAHDAWLLFAGVVVLVIVPWNPALWWQVARLRGAIEVDCDRRVLRRDPDVRRYARLLLDTSRRQGLSRLGVTGFAHPPSLLERRIRTMTDRRRPRRLRAAVVAALGTIVLATACRLDRPTEPNLADPIVTDQAESGPDSPFHVSARAENGVITGTVTDAATGQPLGAVRVTLPDHEMGSITNVRGRFLMINVPAGEHDLVVEDPETAGRVELRIAVAPGADAVAPTPIGESPAAGSGMPAAAPVRPAPPWAGMSPDELGTLTGRVLDADGEPLGSVSVRIPELEIGGLTRPDGRFLLLRLPPGEYRVEVGLPDGRVVVMPEAVEVVAGEQREASLSVRRSP